MIKGITEVVTNNKNILKNFLKNEDIDFLTNLYNKQNEINSELNDIEVKKENVTQKLSENNISSEKDPKKLREYINTSETVLESIEILYKNLCELKSNYISIENKILIIIEKLKANIDINDVIEDIDLLSNKISMTLLYESNIKNDNEKNYLIINSFFEKSVNNNIELNKPINFRELTIDNLKDNLVLKICDERVELPYTKKEIENFLKEYPDDYKTVQDVILKEFIVHMSLFNRHPILSRFREAYYLCRSKEMQSVFDSFIFAKTIMLRSDINPYIIAAVKSKKQLEDYIDCIEKNELDDFKYFKIVFEVNPLAV